MTAKEQVRQLKKILDALIKAEKADNDTAEIIHDTEIAKLKMLSIDNILDAVKEAIGKNTRRRNVSVYVFAELYYVPGIEDVFLGLLNSVDAADRSIIIQTIGLRKLKAFVQILNSHFYKETDPDCRGALIYTLGTLADDSSFPIFLDLAQNPNDTYNWRLVWAFKNFAKDESKPFLERIFSNKQSETSQKVVAAWGLVKIGDKSYYNYLLKMLDDPDVATPDSYSPGQSLRAAQAICDINKWEFIWNADYVPVVKARLKNGS